MADRGPRVRAPRRGPITLLVTGLVSAAIYSVGFGAADGGHATRFFPALAYPLLALYLGAVVWVLRRRAADGGRILWVIVGFAVVFRLLALADPPSLSSDVYRYPWDGRVQRAGHSPYAYPPEAPELAALRDAAIHPHINRPWARTVYPPGSQVLFAALPDHVDGVRLVMVLLDLLTVFLLIRLLRHLGLDPARVVIYAWAPLVVYEVANNGHVEAAVLPLLVGAVLAWRTRRALVTGLLLGLATAMKLYPVLLGAALSPRRRRDFARATVAGAAVVVGLYLAYGLAAGRQVLGFLPQYVGVAEDHNIGLRRLLEWPLSGLVQHPRGVAFGLCVALLGAGAIWILRHEAPPERKALAIAGLYLCTLPTAFHPWYALWLVPWLCVTPHPAWLWLLAALPLSYLKYGAPGDVLPAWVVPLEWGPTAVLLAVPWLRRGARAAPSAQEAPC